MARQVAQDPRHAHAVVALGVVQSRAGDLDSAVQTLRRAVELDPENTFAHQNLGACLLKRGESKEAEAHFRVESTTAAEALAWAARQTEPFTLATCITQALDARLSL